MNPWSLAWTRFRRDRVGLWSFFVVLLFLALVAGSGAGLVARGWEKEAGVSYAPPSFVGRDLKEETLTKKDARPARSRCKRAQARVQGFI